MDHKMYELIAIAALFVPGVAGCGTKEGDVCDGPGGETCSDGPWHIVHNTKMEEEA